MISKQKGIWIILLVFLLAIAAACGEAGTSEQGNEQTGKTMTLPDREADIIGQITEIKQNQADEKPSENHETAAEPVDPNTPVSSRDSASSASNSNILGWVMIEENPEKENSGNKVYTAIKKSTLVFMQDGEKAVPVSFDKLSSGQTVRTWFIGPVQESYPAKANADVLIIAPDSHGTS